MSEYQIIRVLEKPDGPSRWAVMRCTKDGPNGAPVSVHSSLVAAQQALMRLLDSNTDLPDPNPELATVTHEIKWI